MGTWKGHKNKFIIFINEKFKKIFYSFSCIFSDYMAHDINKEFWKNSHFENMTAGFPFEVTKLTSVFYPWNDSFLGMKKIDLTANNVIAFDSIKIQTQ